MLGLINEPIYLSSICDYLSKSSFEIRLFDKQTKPVYILELNMLTSWAQLTLKHDKIMLKLKIKLLELGYAKSSFEFGLRGKQAYKLEMFCGPSCLFLVECNI